MAGTPVKSWSRTRLGRKAISRLGSSAAVHVATASTSSAVTVLPVLAPEDVLEQDAERVGQAVDVVAVGERVKNLKSS